jgi:hypothetical protein
MLERSKIILPLASSLTRTIAAIYAAVLDARRAGLGAELTRGPRAVHGLLVLRSRNQIPGYLHRTIRWLARGGGGGGGDVVGGKRLGAER